MTYADVIRKVRTDAEATGDKATVALCDKVLEQRVSGERKRMEALMALASAHSYNPLLQAFVTAARARPIGQVLQWPVQEDAK